MKTTIRSRLFATGGFLALAGGLLAFFTVSARESQAGIFGRCRQGCDGHHGGDIETFGEVGGTWYWLRSPEEEKRVVMGLFNRYCIRCHGVDGRGVWDIPDVPDFTDGRFQSSRSDGQLARTILEGRGAVMPPFRGTVSLEESWAMARYLRTFVPGSETPRPEKTR
jgi:Cytochrome C oxidase, cbb3-type, subunit III